MVGRWVVAVAAMLSMAVAHADTPADFYHGKQIFLVLGYGPGGGYDILRV